MIPVLETFAEQEDSENVPHKLSIDKASDLRRQRSQIELRERSEERDPKPASSKVLKVEEVQEKLRPSS